MIRNAFVFSSIGTIHHFEPRLKGDMATKDFAEAAKYASAFCGGSIMLSSTITVDCLLSMREVIEGELTTRASALVEQLPTPASAG